MRVSPLFRLFASLVQSTAAVGSQLFCQCGTSGHVTAYTVDGQWVVPPTLMDARRLGYGICAMGDGIAAVGGFRSASACVPPSVSPVTRSNESGCLTWGVLGVFRELPCGKVSAISLLTYPASTIGTPPAPMSKNRQCLTAEPGVGSCAHFSPKI